MPTYRIINSSLDAGSRYVYLAKHLDLLLRQHEWIPSDTRPDYIFIIDAVGASDNDAANVFYVIFISDVVKHYCNIAANKGKYLIIRDIDINITIPSRTCVQFISYPLPYVDSYKQSEAHINNIFVSCRGRIFQNCTLLKLVMPFNKLSHATVIFDSCDYAISKTVNDNVAVIDVKDDISTFVTKSDLIVGSGLAIVEAIIQKKLFIIVGETGYGGIPDARNILKYHDTFFSGNIGGNLFEPIPTTLLLEDVSNIANNKVEYNLADYGEILSQKSYTSLENAISTFSIGGNVVFNTDYTIIAKEGRYILLNRYNRKVIDELDQHTAFCISNGDISQIEKTRIDYLQSKCILISK